jgi:hypothetical protein
MDSSIITNHRWRLGYSQGEFAGISRLFGLCCEHSASTSSHPRLRHFETCLLCWSSQHGVSTGNPFPSKQAFWDHPGVLADRNIIESSLGDARSRAYYLAAGALHTGGWLQAMPASICGLKLDDEAVRVAVGLRLGYESLLTTKLPLWHPG